MTLFRSLSLLLLSAFVLASCAPESRKLPASPSGAALVREKEGRIGTREAVCTTDRFQQPTEPVTKKVDVLFVMDNSYSMRRHWQLMARSIGKLIHEFPAGQDLRFGVILGTITKFDGVLFSAPRVPKVLDNRTMSVTEIVAALNSTFAFARARENTDWKGAGEALFYSLYQAVTSKAQKNQALGFFRPDAALSVIFMSDDAEEGFPYPSRQVWGLPPKCNWGHHETMRKTFYAPRGIDTDSTFAAVQRLKGDMPLLTSAFVNITKEDILVDNSLNARCLFDSPGFGYFDMVRKTDGLLYSIHKNREQGLALSARLLRRRLELLHDFRLSRPAERVDPASIRAAVDGLAAAHSYIKETNTVHLDNAGGAGSLVEISHCEPLPPPSEWGIADFHGSVAQTTAELSWRTPGMDTDSELRFGLLPDALNDRVPSPQPGQEHRVAVSGLTPDTEYYFQAVARDGSGKEQKSELLRLRSHPDWNAGPLLGQASRNSVTLSWSTLNYPTIGYVSWGPAPDQLVNRSPDSPSGVEHTTQISGLSADTSYFFQAVSRDGFGLEKASEIVSLRTRPDWGVLGLTGSAGRFEAGIRWATPEEDSTGRLFYGKSAEQLDRFADSSVFGRTHTLQLSGLEAGTPYFFQVLARSSNGEERRSQMIQLRTLNDWSLSGISYASTESTISISYQTPGFPTDGLVLWGLSPADLGRVMPAGENTESHETALSGLSPDTPYYLQLVAKDSLGLEKRSGTLEIRTGKAPEPLPEWTLSGFAGSARVDSASLRWQTSEYPTRGTLLWGTGPDQLGSSLTEPQAAKDHLLEVGGLLPDTTYYFQVLARDDRGQERASSVIALRTQSLPPAWSVVGFDGTTTSTQANLIWQTPGQETRARIRVGLSAADLSWKLQEVPDFAGSHVVGVPGLSPDTVYFFQVEASDRFGRSALSQVITKRTKP